jgi:hypothetical protein
MGDSNESSHIAELTQQNATLRRQLEDSKQLLSSVTEQIQEVGLAA